MKQVEIFTDGACKGNPGPGGWGAVIRYGRHEKDISGSDPDTTNNPAFLDHRGSDGHDDFHEAVIRNGSMVDLRSFVLAKSNQHHLVQQIHHHQILGLNQHHQD